MRLYLAAIYANSLHRKGRIYQMYWNDRERAALDGVQHILESYHYIKSPTKVRHIRDDQRRIFLDSGAFSAFTLGKTIDIRSYARFIRDHLDIIEHFEDATGIHLLASVLDAIGSADNTWRNQTTLEQMGITPLPCYHYGEPEEVLQYYIEKYDYITIGGMVPITTSQLIYWLDRIWMKYLSNTDGTAKRKVHGFGLTSVRLMHRYPWYSVDSSSWVQTAANGGIVLPGMATAIIVSNDSAYAKKEGQHFNTLTKPLQDALRWEVERRGFDMQRIQTNTYTRRAFNCLIFTEMKDDRRVVTDTFDRVQPTIF